MTNDKQLLKFLRRRLKALSPSQLATALGYRSPVTVWKWMKTNRIPPIAYVRVEKYQQQVEYENAKSKRGRGQ